MWTSNGQMFGQLLQLCLILLGGPPPPQHTSPEQQACVGPILDATPKDTRTVANKASGNTFAPRRWIGASLAIN